MEQGKCLSQETLRKYVFIIIKDKFKNESVHSKIHSVIDSCSKYNNKYLCDID